MGLEACASSDVSRSCKLCHVLSCLVSVLSRLLHVLSCFPTFCHISHAIVECMVAVLSRSIMVNPGVCVTAYGPGATRPSQNVKNLSDLDQKVRNVRDPART